jgi:hypothetical protein
VRNPDAGDGLWVVLGARQVIYVKQTLPLKEQARAVKELMGAPEPPPSSIDDF